MARQNSVCFYKFPQKDFYLLKEIVFNLQNF